MPDQLRKLQFAKDLEIEPIRGLVIGTLADMAITLSDSSPQIDIDCQ